MDKYLVGDFIRLRDINAYQIDRVPDIAINIFQISKIDQNYVEVLDCIQHIKHSDIMPIPINGEDDLQIYYNPKIAADFIGEAFVAKPTNFSYYLDALKNCRYRGETFYDLIKKRNFNMFMKYRVF